MTSALDRYLRAAPPAPNARLPGLKIPRVPDPLGGGVDWWAVCETLAEQLVAAGTPEAEQGLGRLLGATVQALGGEPGLERVAELLLFGDAVSTAFARDLASRQSLRLKNSGWLDDVAARAGDVVAPGFSPGSVDRTLVDGMMEAISAGHYLRRPSGGWGLTSVLHAVEQLLSVLLRFRRDLAPEEVVALAHGLLDPGAPRAAPGGLWSRSTRHGVVVRVAYGRGRREVLRAAFRRNHVLAREDLPDYGAPIHNHILTSFKPAPGAAPAGGDRRAALADLVQRGVRVWHGQGLAPAEAEELAAAGFEGAPDFMTISHARARALALLLPRPIG